MKMKLILFRKYDYLLDVDECANSTLNNCHADAICTNNNGSFTCTCVRGYNGDGVTCSGSTSLYCKLLCCFYFFYMIILK